jgi:hypothetical protein
MGKLGKSSFFFLEIIVSFFGFFPKNPKNPKTFEKYLDFKYYQIRNFATFAKIKKVKKHDFCQKNRLNSPIKFQTCGFLRFFEKKIEKIEKGKYYSDQIFAVFFHHEI